jgi:hypothetical protein
MDLCMDLQDRRLGRHHGDEDARNVGGGRSDACSVIARTEAASHPPQQKKECGRCPGKLEDGSSQHQEMEVCPGLQGPGLKVTGIVSGRGHSG